MMGYATSKGQCIALGVIFAIIPIIAATLRFLARHLIRARYGLDDYLIIPAAICAIVGAITLIIGAYIAELGQHQKQVHDANGNIIIDQQLINYEKVKLSIQIFSVTAVGLAKLCVVLLYGRIFSARRWFRFVVYGFTTFLTSWLIAFFFALLFQCTPVSTLWMKFEFEFQPYCVDVITLYYAFSVTDAVTDCAIFVLPLPVLWSLQLPLKQKIAVAGMFLLGATIIAISWTRLGIFLTVGPEVQSHPHDYVFYNTSAITWSVIEASLSVLCACLPVLRPIFVRDARTRKLKSSSSYATNPTAPTTLHSTGGLVRRMRAHIEDDEEGGWGEQGAEGGESRGGESGGGEGGNGEGSINSHTPLHSLNALSARLAAPFSGAESIINGGTDGSSSGRNRGGSAGGKGGGSAPETPRLRLDTVLGCEGVGRLGIETPGRLGIDTTVTSIPLEELDGSHVRRSGIWVTNELRRSESQRSKEGCWV